MRAPLKASPTALPPATPVVRKSSLIELAKQRLAKVKAGAKPQEAPAKKKRPAKRFEGVPVASQGQDKDLAALISMGPASILMDAVTDICQDSLRHDMQRLLDEVIPDAQDFEVLGDALLEVVDHAVSPENP